MCISINMLPFQYIYTKNGTNGQWQVPFVCCKQKTETLNFRLFYVNVKWKLKFVFLGRRTIKGNRRLLFQ